MWRKKGRPKMFKPERDLGTMELQQKRMMRFTDDPLDLCLERNIIDSKQYYAALQIRRLFNTTFGHLKIKAYDPSNIGGQSVFYIEDVETTAKAKKRYDNIMKKLIAIGFDGVVSDVCIHAYAPSFLYINLTSASSPRLVNKKLSDIQHFQDALYHLEKVCADEEK